MLSTKLTAHLRNGLTFTLVLNQADYSTRLPETKEHQNVSTSFTYRKIRISDLRVTPCQRRPFFEIPHQARIPAYKIQVTNVPVRNPSCLLFTRFLHCSWCWSGSFTGSHPDDFVVQTSESRPYEAQSQLEDRIPKMYPACQITIPLRANQRAPATSSNLRLHSESLWESSKMIW